MNISCCGYALSHVYDPAEPKASNYHAVSADPVSSGSLAVPIQLETAF